MYYVSVIVDFINIPHAHSYYIFSDVGAFQEVWKYFCKFIFPIYDVPMYLLCLNLLHGITEMQWCSSEMRGSGAAESKG
jgi:hypothetical protein